MDNMQLVMFFCVSCDSGVGFCLYPSPGFSFCVTHEMFCFYPFVE